MNKPSTYIPFPADKATHLYLDKYTNELILSPLIEPNERCQYLHILSDDDIKDCYYLVLGINKVKHTKEAHPSIWNNVCKKIIATTNPELLNIRVNMNSSGNSYDVPPISQSDIEYIISLYNKKDEVDVKQLASDSWSDESGCRGFVEGFNKCSELNADKKFTLEDMRKACRYIPDTSLDDEKIYEQIDKFIQSLTKEQPKSDTVVVEYEEMVSMSREHLLTGSDVEIEARKNKFLAPKLKDGCIVIVRN